MKLAVNFFMKKLLPSSSESALANVYFHAIFTASHTIGRIIKRDTQFGHFAKFRKAILTAATILATFSCGMQVLTT